MADLDQEWAESVKGEDIKSLAKRLVELREQHDTAKAIAAIIWAKVDYLRLTLLPDLMDELGTTSMKINGVGRLGLGTSATCKTLDKEALQQWLRDNGHGDLIVPTINGSSLKAFIGHQIQDAEEIPDESIIEYGTFSLVSITKG